MSSQADLKQIISLPLFCQEWWLDLVYGKNQWDHIYERNDDGLHFFLPYAIGRKRLLNYMVSPPLTLYSGPWLFQDPEVASTDKKQAFNFILNLPKTNKDTFRFWNKNGIKKMLQEAGFKVRPQSTYILEDLKDHENLWTQLRYNAKKNINRGAGNYTIIESQNAKLLYKLYSKTLKEKEIKQPSGEDFVIKTVKEISERGQGKLYAAKDKNGEIKAMTLFAWDSHAAYSLYRVVETKQRNKGVLHFLIWEAIKELSKKVNRLDFLGSDHPGIKRFVESFGANMHTYYLATRFKPGFLGSLYRLR